jgi:hypothetical protein
MNTSQGEPDVICWYRVFEPAELTIKRQLFSCSKDAVILFTALIRLDAINILSSVGSVAVLEGVVVASGVAVIVVVGVLVGVGVVSGFAENAPLYAM